MLRLLLSLEGRVVSHQMIEDTLWPRQVVSYASMARCVYSLRKHLDAEGETYIQTIRGYLMPLEGLKQARQEHCVWLPPIRLDPRLAPLADDPGFQALFN